MKRKQALRKDEIIVNGKIKRLSNNRLKIGDKIRFYVIGTNDDWDITPTEFSKLMKYDGQVAKITGHQFHNYYFIEFADGYSPDEAVDLTEFARA